MPLVVQFENNGNPSLVVAVVPTYIASNSEIYTGYRASKNELQSQYCMPKYTTRIFDLHCLIPGRDTLKCCHKALVAPGV